MCIRDSNKPEYSLLILLALVGMMLMISADNLMSLYMAIELQSLPLYVVAAMRTNSLRSSEAGLKYFLLGALSSGMLLYGASLVYGFAGSTDFGQISAALAGRDLPPVFIWHGVHGIRSCLQDIGRTFPYVDTGCI